MLDYNQRELLEEIEFSGMDVSSYIDELIGSPTIEKLRENLLTLITEAKHLVEKAEELQGLLGVTEDKGGSRPMRIAVLIDEDGNILSAHGPFSSSEELRVWAEQELKKAARVEWWKYEDVRLVGVTEDKG